MKVGKSPLFVLVWVRNKKCHLGVNKNNSTPLEDNFIGFLSFSQAMLVINNPSANAEDISDLGLIPGLGRSPGVGNGNPLHSCLENFMSRGTWQASSMGVTKSQTQLSDQAYSPCLELDPLSEMESDEEVKGKKNNGHVNLLVKGWK